MDETGTVSHYMQLQVLWREVEPLPGVYDWSEADRIVDYARENGLMVMTPSPFFFAAGSTPSAARWRML